MLMVGIGLGAVGTTRRSAVRDGLAHARVENELRLHIRELGESRARVSQVADAERRRIERDLHDGCQQQLIALRVKLSLAEELVQAGTTRRWELIHQISEDAESALEDLHALVHGIYPSILLDRGLAAALKAIGRSAPMPVRVLADGTSRYPADVEAAVYFACAEALQNTAKHAGTGATARIALSSRRLRAGVRGPRRRPRICRSRQRRKRAGQHEGPPQRDRRTPAGHVSAGLRDQRSGLGGRGRAPRLRCFHAKHQRRQSSDLTVDSPRCATRSLATVARSPSGCSAPPACSSSSAGSHRCSTEGTAAERVSRPSHRGQQVRRHARRPAALLRTAGVRARSIWSLGGATARR